MSSINDATPEEWDYLKKTSSTAAVATHNNRRQTMENEHELSLQHTLLAAVEAHNKGVKVDWQLMCVNTYNAAMAEIARLNEVIEDVQQRQEGDEQ